MSDALTHNHPGDDNWEGCPVCHREDRARIAALEQQVASLRDECDGEFGHKDIIATLTRERDAAKQRLLELHYMIVRAEETGAFEPNREQKAVIVRARAALAKGEP